MLTLLVVLCAVAVCVRRLAPRHPAAPWLGALVGFTLFLSFSFETLLRDRPLFLSDELFYLTEGRQADLTAPRDRYLWILLNGLILRFDWAVNGLPLKLVSLPLLALTTTLLWRMFGRDRLVWLIPVVMPYVAYTAIFNFRDTAILTATVGCVFLLDSRAGLSRLWFIPTLVALYLLRPGIALVSAVTWLVVVIAWRLPRLVRGRVPARSIAVLGGGVLLAGVVFFEPVLDRIQRYEVWSEYALGRGYAERALERGVEPTFVVGPLPRTVVVSAGRYTLAPIPTSLVERLAQGGSAQWGLVDDFVRLLHQLTFYGILLFLFVRWRYWSSALRSLERGQVMIFAALSLYLPIYAVYHFGLSHQRVKIPFQLAVALFALVVHRTRQAHGQHNRRDGVEDEGARVRRSGSEGDRIAP